MGKKGSAKVDDKKQGLKEILKGFFKHWYFGWLTLGLIPALLSVFFYFNTIEEIAIYPNLSNMDYQFYTDTANNGNSKITKAVVNDSLLQFNFDLNAAFVTPYVGVEMHQKDAQPIKLWPYNQVEIDVEGEVLHHLLVSLYSNIKENENVGYADILCFAKDIKLNPGRNKYVFSVEQFRIPDWYNDAFQIPHFKTFRPHFREIKYVNINNAYHYDLLKQASIKLYALRFTRNNSPLIYWLLSLFIAVLLVQSLFYFFIKKKRPKESSKETIFYKPVSINESVPQSEQDYLNYINTNFSNPSLSLESVSKATGRGQRYIANGIQDSYQCNFKTYVNQIRITEAKRLLQDTDLNINEIAYNVGFNSQSHFARVFKSLSNLSPSAYRGN